MSWQIIVVLLGFLLVVLLLDLRVVFYYEHPDDSKYNPGLVAKCMTLLGLELCWLMLAGIPSDSSNTQTRGGLLMDVYWRTTYALALVFLVIPVPYALTFYETDTDPRVSKGAAWLAALKTTAIAFVISAVVLLALFFAMRRSEIKVCPVDGTPCKIQPAMTPFFIYSGILVGFFGWIMTTIYLGMGLITVPTELILGFTERPKPISQQDYNDAKAVFAERIVTLKAIGEDIRTRERDIKEMKTSIAKYKAQNKFRSDFNKFRKDIVTLQSEFEAFNVAYKQRGENPFFSYLKLAAGVLCSVLSCLWIVQIFLHILLPQILRRPVYGFLDNFMQLVAKAKFYLLDLLVYEFLVGYLLLCTMIGCFRINAQMTWCCTIHPMKKGETHQNSLLFNTALILVDAHAITQFSYVALRNYCSGTYAEQVYGYMAPGTPVFGFFYRNNIFIWIMIVWTLLCIVFTALKARGSTSFSLERIKELRLTSRLPLGSDKDKKEGGEAGGGGLEMEMTHAMGKIEKTANVMKFAF